MRHRDADADGRDDANSGDDDAASGHELIVDGRDRHAAAVRSRG